ncbi:transmembrane and coiled-coil domains containing protein [Babesia ovis]|uniref:Transmembrane and coiled-coil domains containing protein n=1 Tax=Babesia ovis TaxID=5869 RepID=A0A9W5WVW3_BABOV|nr:transmembrane and coiled-coil domains containing protein [Babesia ovis]
MKEVASLLFVYRKPEYKRKFDELNQRFEEYHRTYVLFEPRSANYNCFNAVTLRLLEASKELRDIQPWYNFVTGALFMLLMLLVMSYFEGCVVAKLPFTPVWPIKIFTKGDIGGDDPTNCSATCLYTMLSMAAKDTVQVFLGYRCPVTAWTEVNLKSMAKDE